MNIKRVMRFLTSGGLAAAVEYGIFATLVVAFPDVWVMVQQTSSFIAGFVVSFILNRKWVFKTTSGARRQLVAYSILALVNLVLSNVFVWLMVDVFTFNAFVVKIISMGLIAAWNYLIFSKIIFVEK